MKNILFFVVKVIIFIFPLFHLKGQVTKKLGGGYAYTSLDLPGDIANAGQLNLEVGFKKRFLWGIDLTLLNYNGKEGTFNLIPENRKRLGFDIAVKYSIIKYKNSNFNIGLGPSFWFKKESIVKSMHFETQAGDNTVKILDFERVKNEGMDIGYHFMSEIDLNLYKSVNNNYFVKVIDLGNGGVVSILGFGFKFKL